MSYLIQYDYDGGGIELATDAMFIREATSFNDINDPTSACAQITKVISTATNFTNKTVLNGQIKP